jgi:peptide/nickel transport system ATP-binding protein
MYSGEAVETGTVVDVFDNMRHPYTQALFRSIPLPGADKNTRPLVAIPGNFPLPHERPNGCNFGPRCDYFVAGKCDSGDIPMAMFDKKNDHQTRCARFADIDWMATAALADNVSKTAIGEVVLDIDDLKKYYEVSANALFSSKEKKVVKANETISLAAHEAETLAIVGESGCGKSTLAKVLLGLETATSGRVQLLGQDVQDVMIEDRDTKTVSSIQMVFQNPFDTLNPSMSVGRQIIRALEVFGIGNTEPERRQRMLELLDLVKLPREFAERMPRQLSGGQKQRVGIARAFAGDARIVVADEPVSALDVSVQAAVTELLMEIQHRSRTTLLFISHDLSIVRYLSDRVVVMYLGHIVETGTTDEVFAPPYHPYTEALLSAVPIADTRIERKRIVLDGDIPSAVNPPPGCPFQTRCGYKGQAGVSLCETEVPPVRTLEGGHQIKCHLAEDILAKMDPVIALANDNSAKPKNPTKKPAQKTAQKTSKKATKKPAQKTSKKRV